MLTRRLLLGSALAAVSSTFARAENAPTARLNVIATFSILAHFVKNVGGERVEVAALVGANGNAHVYAPSPADAKKVADARLVFVNGLGFEGWLDRLVKASGTRAAIVVASTGIKMRQRASAHGHEHDKADPHAWQSVSNAKVYVVNIRNALVAADPGASATYDANTARYMAELDALDREVNEEIARIPIERRRVISTHDAFGYFEAAYGVHFVAPQGVSTETEASAKDVASIIRQVKQQKIPAVFLENVSDPRLMRQIASETGAKIGGILYSDALTDDKGDAPTYIDLIRHNVKQLAGALLS
jgi:zinc/manganese transport system substrate-binding protein